MIAAARQRHRLAWAACAIALPTLLAAAVAVRPNADSASPQTSSTGAESSASSFSKLDAELRRRGNQLELHLRQPLRSPDVLAYVSNMLAADSLLADSLLAGTLPGDAILLGPVRSEVINRYSLPTDAPQGTLWLYSLAHQTVVDIAQLPGGPS